MFVICRDNYPIEIVDVLTFSEAKARADFLHTEYCERSKTHKDRVIYQAHNVPVTGDVGE